ncbi:MAG: thioredoxin fold domain-containing protein [Ferruginibacter sp.]|nr:thioredoxin fold domain-containing protein [Ferruginibacter sp.]
MKIIRTLIHIPLLFFILFSCHAQKSTNLTVVEFEKAISNMDSIQLLDVRTAGEFNAGHIKHALLADWKDEDEFNRRIGYIDKQKPVYLYCLGGARSAAAAAKMRSMGYRDVHELKGGMNAWKAENKAVEGRSDEKQMTIDELDKAIEGSKLVLVDFGAEWCPPCKKMEPVLKSLRDNYPDKFTLVKVDGGRDEAILKKYKVTALPVFIVFKNGKQVWRKEGVAEEKEIAKLFD